MITLYHSPTARSFRIRWLLGELDTPYKLKLCDFFNQERVAPEYLKLNPMGSIPTMEDDGLVLTESGAMVNYIINKYGGGRFKHPEGSREAVMVDEWMYWSEGLFAIHQRYYWDHCSPPPACVIDPVPRIGEEGKRQAIKYAHMLESTLRDDGFMVGDTLTGADFMLCFPLYHAYISQWLDKLPKTKTYVERFATRPAFQASIDDFKPYIEKLFGSPPSFSSFRQWEADWLKSLQL